MTTNLTRRLFFLAMLASELMGARGLFAQLLDDRAITIHSANDVAEKRRALIQYIWGTNGFPGQRLPDVVLTNVTSPVKQLINLAHVDEFHIELAPELQGRAWHFVPLIPNRQLVVVHQGHACTFDDEPGAADVGMGLQRTIRALLREGYGVLAVLMPRMIPGDCGLTGSHDALFQMKTTGSPMKFFLEPTLISLNQVKQPNRAGHSPRYHTFHMLGLSGGGWTTTIYAAIDPTIRCSFPVAGSIPLYLRSGASEGDAEQCLQSFYRVAGYPDLYILGAQGKGRKQVQILNRKDDCCFGEAQHNTNTTGMAYSDAMRGYEGRIREALKTIGPGTFRLEIDETAPSHMISHHAIERIILTELARSR